MEHGLEKVLIVEVYIHQSNIDYVGRNKQYKSSSTFSCVIFVGVKYSMIHLIMIRLVLCNSESGDKESEYYVPYSTKEQRETFGKRLYMNNTLIAYIIGVVTVGARAQLNILTWSANTNYVYLEEGIAATI